MNHAVEALFTLGESKHAKVVRALIPVLDTIDTNKIKLAIIKEAGEEITRATERDGFLKRIFT